MIDMLLDGVFGGVLILASFLYIVICQRMLTSSSLKRLALGGLMASTPIVLFGSFAYHYLLTPFLRAMLTDFVAFSFGLVLTLVGGTIACLYVTEYVQSYQRSRR